MSLIYITGPAGIGKTTTIRQLRKLGYEAHDADDELCAYYTTNDEKVEYPSEKNVDLVEWENNHTFSFSNELTKLLALKAKGRQVFVCGNAHGNDLEIADKYFDMIICLETDLATMTHRIKTRQATYGKDPAVLALLKREFQRTLDRYRTHGATMLDATEPIDNVAKAVIEVSEYVR